jgi:hypothetical protein
MAGAGKFLKKIMQPPPRPIKVGDEYFVEKEALWTMLSGDAESGKEKEANIRSNLKKLCQMHRLTFNKNKYVTLETIQGHYAASQTLLNGYKQWQHLNEWALTNPDENNNNLPDTVVMGPVGHTEHRCQ